MSKHAAGQELLSTQEYNLLWDKLKSVHLEDLLNLITVGLRDHDGVSSLFDELGTATFAFVLPGDEYLQPRNTKITIEVEESNFTNL